jgi:hypothetical protein
LLCFALLVFANFVKSGATPCFHDICNVDFAVMNNYPQGFGPPASPANSRGFPPANSPGPMDMYSGSTDSVGYVQAASPQPNSFQAIAVSRAPVSYNPVSEAPAQLYS